MRHEERNVVGTESQTHRRWVAVLWLRMLWSLRVLSCLVPAMTAQVGYAALGGHAADVQSDARAMRVARPVRVLPSVATAYSVHEMVLSTGTVIHQYVSASDKVFAVTWSGPSKPDLRQLLGPSFETMNARHEQQGRLGHSAVVQHESDLVVESGGHPRSFAGRAYLPNALPSGVDPTDIR